jgi:RND family efflux transporter MFP subunit
LNGCGSAVAPTGNEASVTVGTAVAEVNDIDKYVTYSGRVRGSNEVTILPKISSRVTTIHLRAGDSVSAGQVIATLDSSDLEAAMAQTRAALISAQSSQASNQIRIDSAERNYERMRSLYESGAISSQALESARDELNALRSGSVSANYAQIEASARSLEQQLQNCQITSPISGIVGWIDLSVGQTVNPQAPVAIINPGADLEVELMITESDISYLSAGQSVEVSIKAIDLSKIAATIKSVSSVADQLSRNYPVLVALENPDGMIKSGMFSEIRLSTLHKSGVVCVPLSAVIPQEGDSVVFLVNAENRAEKVSVKTGVNDGLNIEITQGLQSGQSVVTSGNTLVQNGSLLKLPDGGNEQ